MTDLQTTEQNIGFNEILEQLMEKIEKISIKNALQDKLIINRITSDTVELITINKVAHLIFSNMENMRHIEDTLSEVLGRSIRIKINFENKEDYFARKL